MEDHARLPERWLRSPFSFERFPSGESRYLCAVFGDIEGAKRAVIALEREGCLPSEITVLVADDRRRHRVRTHPEFEGLDPAAVVADPVELDRCRMTLQGAGLGALTGGPLGAIAGWTLMSTTEALGSPVATGLGSLPEAGLPGMVLVALAGAGSLGGLCAIAGGFLGMRRWEYRARRLERTVREGSVLLRARARSVGDLQHLSEKLADAGGDLSLVASH
jgi:hypothetical protein